MRAAGWIVAGFLFLLLLATMGMSAASFGWGIGRGGMEFFFNFGPWLMIGWLWALLPFILVGGLVYWLVERDRTGATDPAAPGPGKALATLERRYAAGEIDREEYLRIREDLDGG